MIGGLRLGAGLQSPATMRRRWLAGIFGVSAVWAALVAVVSSDHVHQLWGGIAAVGYGLALATVLTLRHGRTADIALGLAFLGGLVAPLGYFAVHGGLMQPEVSVVADSGMSLIHHGSPYINAALLASTKNADAYNPYLPVMALFGVPSAFPDLGPLRDPRVWFGLVFIIVFWLSLRGAGARHPMRWTLLAAATPVIAFELAVGGTDVPMVAFLCLGFTLLWQRKPVLAGLALGIGASMKATAWPALVVAVALLWVRDGKRAVRNFALAAVGVVVACVGPFLVSHPKSLIDNTIRFPLGLASVKSAARSPLPGYLISATWPGTGHAIVVVLLALAALGVAALLILRPPRTVPRAVVLLAGAMTLMFVLAPSTRFGYFIYPGGLAIWLIAVAAGRETGDDDLGEIAVGFLPARVPDSPPAT